MLIYHVYHDTESGEILTEDQLRQEFAVLKANGETDADTFCQYLRNCISKNGTLEVVR